MSHTFRRRWTPALALLLVPAATFAAGTDGVRHDPGAAMTSPAKTAPAPVHELRDLIGHWEVSYETWTGDTLTHTATGAAEISLMNRGHAYFCRLHVPDFDGRGVALDTNAFLTFAPGPGRWMLGVADGHRESIVLYDGERTGDGLRLTTALRRGGGARVTTYRASLERPGPDRLVWRHEESNDGDSWSPRVVARYSRRDAGGALPPGLGVGEPHPDLEERARGFDFLLGEWDENHHMTFPNGQEARFPVHGTAVRTLGGRGILEFSAYDVDPSLPDAATSIVRIYNRAMRRWECMYTTNRFNSILYFWGAPDGNSIVLHPFAADAADIPMSFWIFEDITPASYRWHASTSRDGGKTFADTWVIEARRKGDK